MVKVGNYYPIFFDSIPFSIIWVNLDGTIINSNISTEKIFGYTNEDLVNKNFREILTYPKEYLPLIVKMYEALLKGDFTEPLEVQAYKKDGSLIWINIQSAIVQLDKESIIQATLQDITERKKINQQLRDSEKKYRLITENANDLISILSREFVHEYINEKAFFRILGYKKEELLGKPVAKYMKSHEINETTKRFLTAFQAGWGKGEIRMRRKDGTYAWLEVRGTRFINENGIKKYIMISRDSTKRKNAEKKIRLFSEAVAAAYDSIILTDLNGNVTYANDSTLKSFGYSTEDIINLHVSNLTPDPETVKKITKELIQKKKWGDETIAMKKNKEKFPIIASISLIKDEKEKPIGTMIVFRDITGRKKAEEELEKAFERIKKQNEELKELDRMKDEFFADISHELRTPLVAIRGFSELLLLSKALDDLQRQDIETILRNELRLERLVNEMLDYSRLKSGKIQFKKDTFRLSEILKEMKKELKPLINQKQLIITEKFEPDEELNFDKYQITKVIKNFMTNAIKFSFPNGRILIKSHIKNDLWTFSMSDHGIGIVKEDIPKMFNRFARLDTMKGIKISGTGLGLAICKKIIEIYNGKIWVESDGLNKGATFIFQLNAKQNTVKISN